MAGRLAYAGKTDVGLKRSNNEDNFIMVPSHGLFVLADGMGGHASGQVASSMCVSHIAKFICEISHQPGFEMPYKKNPAVSFEANMLINAIKFANERVYIQSCKERSMEGMGTTVTAILNAPHGLILAHVGDSRIYRVRKGQIVQMSRDHSLLNHLLDTGELKPEDAASFTKKNMIFRAIGLKENVDVDVKEVPREKGDVYMMCSDGLSDIVSDAQICQAISSAPNLTEASNALIGLALKAGGKDNVTVVCVGVEEDDAQSQPAQAVSRPGCQNVQSGSRNVPPSMQMIGAVPTRLNQNGPNPQSAGGFPVGMGGPVPVGARAASPQMIGRAQPYPMNGAPNGNPVFQGMVPMPGRAASMPSMPAVAPVQSQLQQPTRMHSVREVVERIAVPRVMPKPIGSAGRPSAANMPAIPGAAKPRKIDAPESLNKAYALNDLSLEDDDTARPTVLDNPILLSDFFKSKDESEKVETGEKKEPALDLPETSLLFTEPPLSAVTPERDPNKVAPAFDYDDDDDDEETVVRRAFNPTEIFPECISEPGYAGNKTIPNASVVAMRPPVAAPQMTIPMTSPCVPSGKPLPPSVPAAGASAVLMSSEDLSSEFSSNRDPEPVKAHSVEPKKGYIPPENVVLPPHFDYDEDEDNIEIAGYDDEDCRVTRTFRKPDFKW